MVKLNWGIVGLGRIATSFAEDFPRSAQNLYGAAARDQNRANAFAKEHDIPHAFGSYASMFADPNVNVVYIATPHPFHYAQIKAALLAGKHVLAEKSITLNSDQLQELIDIARSKHLILMEAQTIYHMPLYHTILEHASVNDLGDLKTIQVTFGSYVPNDPNDRLLNIALGGGALLDIGVYALSFARRFTGSPLHLLATQMTPTRTGVDGQSSFLLSSGNGTQITVALNLQAKMPKRGLVVFNRGFYTVDQYPRADKATFTTPELKSSTVAAGATKDALPQEVIDMAAAVETGENPTLAWTSNVMDIMTAARQEWGFKYPAE
ncbi:Gfo/Idh/MocA family protein [Lacticaseibacillus zhaodongensis]|uniref:Gfo/Idh/MocA family protein n=1 Tax=Lacticaseibacillus zhaodongensis TaxID=2668065 RepID=UPI0012D30BD5|nr:Gfo/Idh/MocA family oxidoreductase [Lacticaseibacillus zhaodongensis]